MKSNFNFKSLFKRLPNVSIPKEFVYFGIGAIIVVTIGLIVGNMYLQEMLYFEGEEKSLQMFTEEELREYGELYKELSLDFQNEIGSYVEGYARREGSGAKDFVNRAGERIHYGIFNHEHPIDDTNLIKKHSNGANTNKSENSQKSDIDDSFNNFSVEDSYIDSDEYKNGITIKYAKTDGREDGESNFKDILTIVSILIDQKQSDNTYLNSSIEVDLKSKIPDLIRDLFKMSHTFNGDITDLYPCEKGCRALFYYCNEDDNGISGYEGTGINLKPFDINVHDGFEDYAEEDFEIIDAENECILCGHNGKGCIVDSKKCHHGNTNTTGDGILGNMGTSYGDCLNYVAVPRCTYVGESEHDCHAGEAITTEPDGEGEPVLDSMGNQKVRLGCGGYYKCLGHEHWNCPGHFYVCCMGHRDITIKIKIMYIDEMLNVIKNGYNTTD